MHVWLNVLSLLFFFFKFGIFPEIQFLNLELSILTEMTGGGAYKWWVLQGRSKKKSSQGHHISSISFPFFLFVWWHFTFNSCSLYIRFSFSFRRLKNVAWSSVFVLLFVKTQTRNSGSIIHVQFTQRLETVVNISCCGCDIEVLQLCESARR